MAGDYWPFDTGPWPTNAVWWPEPLRICSPGADCYCRLVQKDSGLHKVCCNCGNSQKANVTADDKTAVR